MAHRSIFPIILLSDPAGRCQQASLIPLHSFNSLQGKLAGRFQSGGMAAAPHRVMWCTSSAEVELKMLQLHEHTAWKTRAIKTIKITIIKTLYLSLFFLGMAPTLLIGGQVSLYIYIFSSCNYSRTARLHQTAFKYVSYFSWLFITTPLSPPLLIRLIPDFALCDYYFHCALKFDSSFSTFVLTFSREDDHAHHHRIKHFKSPMNSICTSSSALTHNPLTTFDLWSWTVPLGDSTKICETMILL